MRKLSTNLTLVWRIYAIAWISFFPIASIYDIYKFLILSERDVNIPKIILFILFGLVSSVFTHFMVGTLKNVFLEGDSLVISNFVKQIRVPFSEISHVDNPDYSNLRRIKIIFHQPTEFGKEIVFAPSWFDAKEIAKLLKSKIETDYLSL